MYLKEQAAIEDKELDVTEMAKEIYRVVSSLYYKADAKLSPPVIMDDMLGVVKIKRCWKDINKIIWKKGPKFFQEECSYIAAHVV